MKRLRTILTVTAIGLGTAMASSTRIPEVQIGYFDANGPLPSGGETGIVQNSYSCQIQWGTICTIVDEWAFNTAENAEANQGRQTNPSAIGLLKYNL